MFYQGYLDVYAESFTVPMIKSLKECPGPVDIKHRSVIKSSEGTKCEPVARRRELSLHQLRLVFLFLAGGVLCSSFVFVLEWAWKIAGK